MKSLITATVLALALTGCAANDDKPSADMQSAVKDAADNHATDAATLKDVGRQALRDQQPLFTAGQSDGDIDALAEATCDAFDAGATPEEMVIAAMDDDLVGEVGSVMALAAMAYCPEHQDVVDEFSEAY